MERGPLQQFITPKKDMDARSMLKAYAYLAFTILPRKCVENTVKLPVAHPVCDDLSIHATNAEVAWGSKTVSESVTRMYFGTVPDSRICLNP